MKFLEEIKKQSSKWVKTKDIAYSNFYWQNGYGIFSVNPSEIDIVSNYITNQTTHHTKLSFQDEFRAFLKKHKVDYDERYVWDYHTSHALTGLEFIIVHSIWRCHILLLTPFQGA